jgi:hypothetical protein
MSNPDAIDECVPAKQKKCRLQGRCANCESPIPAAKRLCPACRQLEQEAKDNVHVWKAPTGEVVKRRVPRVSITARVVYDIMTPTGGKFAIDGASAPFLESLIGLCYDQPPYIRATDVARYAAMLHSLLHFRSQPCPWKENSPLVDAEEIPLQRLGIAVREWIMSFFGEQYHPLMPVYALDTACFVAAHGEGTYFPWNGSRPAEIPAMVEGDFSIGCLNNPAFKAEFTQRLTRRRFFVAEIPGGCSIVGPNEEAMGPGTRFFFGVARCHLSGAWYDYVALEAREDNAPEYDIGAVLLPGQVLVDASGSVTLTPSQATSRYAPSLDLPLRWITHAVREERDKTVLLPVPLWE